MRLPEEEKEKIEAALVRAQSREVVRRTKEREGEALREWKRDEEKKVEGGKKKFYLKKSTYPRPSLFLPTTLPSLSTLLIRERSQRIKEL